MTGTVKFFVNISVNIRFIYRQEEHLIKNNLSNAIVRHVRVQIHVHLLYLLLNCTDVQWQSLARLIRVDIGGNHSLPSASVKLGPNVATITAVSCSLADVETDLNDNVERLYFPDSVMEVSFYAFTERGLVIKPCRDAAKGQQASCHEFASVACHDLVDTGHVDDR